MYSRLHVAYHGEHQAINKLIIMIAIRGVKVDMFQAISQLNKIETAAQSGLGWAGYPQLFSDLSCKSLVVSRGVGFLFHN